MDLQDFSAYYAGLPDGELAKIASSRRILVPEARRCLDAEIAKRGLTPEDIKRFKNYRHSYHAPESPLQRKIRRSKLLGKVNEIRRMPRLRWRGMFLCMLASFLLAALMGHFGMLEHFRPVVGTAVVLFFTLRFHWELRSRPWFWIVLLAWLSVHVWIIMKVHWPTGWVPAKVLEGYTTIDLVAVFVSIALVERLLHEGPFAPRARQAAK